jgi:quinol monooxygenase YgiN
MVKLALYARLEAKPGKEKEVEQFLQSAAPMAEEEQGTITWYALRMGPSTFGIFDTFNDETGPTFSRRLLKLAKWTFWHPRFLQTPNARRPRNLTAAPTVRFAPRLPGRSTGNEKQVPHSHPPKAGGWVRDDTSWRVALGGGVPGKHRGPFRIFAPAAPQHSSAHATRNMHSLNTATMRSNASSNYV